MNNPSCGGVPERLNGAVSKTVVGSDIHPGFESLLLRQKSLHDKAAMSSKISIRPDCFFSGLLFQKNK